MRRTPLGQAARKVSGSTAEDLVKGILEEDPKLRGSDITVRPNAELGLDIIITPPCPSRTNCPKPILMEAKSIEKLFEKDPDSRYFPNRLSRFVLKQNEDPDCYVFITRDELTQMTAVDFISNCALLKEWKEKGSRGENQRGVSLKLPVRAIPVLRRYPCSHVTRTTEVRKEARRY